MKNISKLFAVALIATFGVACNQGSDEQVDDQDSTAVVEEAVTEEVVPEEVVVDTTAVEDTATVEETSGIGSE